MASEQIVYYIIAKDQASKKFKDVGDASEKAGSRISGGFSKIGLLAGGAAAAIGGLGAAGAIMGIKTAASLEQANIGFTTLLGSSQKAGAYVKDLQKFAANTPFEFQGLVDSSRLLLGVGVASQKVIPMLTDFGDAAGALGIQQDAFQRIMLATSQSISAGKFQVGDINQLVNNGLPAWSLLSKAMGKPVPELRKLASAGKLTADVVLPALQREMHKDYGGSMAKQSQTLAGLWSTFTDTLSQGLAQAMLPLVPMLKSILPGAMSFMGVALQGLAAGLKFVITGVQGIVKWFHSGSASAQGITSAVSGLVKWVKSDLAPALGNLVRDILPSLKTHFTTIAGAIQQNQGLFKALGAILTTVVIPAVGLLVKFGLAQMDRQIKLISATVHGLGVVFTAVFTAITRTFLTVVGTIIHGAAKAFGWVPGIGGKLKAADRQFSNFAKSVRESLAGIPSHKEINIIAKANLDFTQTGNSNKRAAADHRAGGGPVRRGQAYIVGENRPELFIPDQNGYIDNGSRNGSSGAALAGGGGGGNVFITVTGSLIGTDEKSLAREVHKLLVQRKRETGTALGLA